jgi:hypothetical protein
MDTKHSVLMLNLFRLRILAISQKHGAGSQYIQGQLNEARHQLQLHARKLFQGSSRDGF